MPGCGGGKWLGSGRAVVELEYNVCPDQVPWLCAAWTGRACELPRVLCPLQVPVSSPCRGAPCASQRWGELRGVSAELCNAISWFFFSCKALLVCCGVPFLMDEILKLGVNLAFICAFFQGIKIMETLLQEQCG